MYISMLWKLWRVADGVAKRQTAERLDRTFKLESASSN